jgi:phage baseplate assembly protein gpV
VTNWIPVKTQASSFLVVHTPVRIGDQVIVLNPYGNNEDGFVIRGLTKEDIPLPDEADEDTFIAKFNDKTTYIHNTNNKEISLTTPCSVTINIAKSVSIECDSATLKANSVTVDSASIDLGKGGMGVITAESICPFTGSPHMDESKNTRSVK